MTPAKALAFIERHGVVLASAKGPVLRLAEAVVGEPIRGSWWAHPRSRDIYAVFEAVSSSPQVLVCRLVGGKVTFVHRRLWPALVRAAAHFRAEQLAEARQEHTEHGHHERRDRPYPDWVPADVKRAAARLGESQALEALGPWIKR